MNVIQHRATSSKGARLDWNTVSVSLANQLARADFPRGDLAALRRMAPTAIYAAPFWRLAAQHDLLRGAVLERKWALIIHGIALMTPTVGRRTAHDPLRPVGSALYLGAEETRTSGFYSHSRLNRLLTARGMILQTLLIRMFRMIASAGVSFDWREMTRFIRYEDYDGKLAEESRHRVARAYYREEHRHARAADG